jgi:hypothetical protein
MFDVLLPHVPVPNEAPPSMKGSLHGERGSRSRLLDASA